MQREEGVCLEITRAFETHLEIHQIIWIQIMTVVACTHLASFPTHVTYLKRETMGGARREVWFQTSMQYLF